MAGTKLTRNLPNNAYQAAVNANAPSPVNVYATIDDLPSALASNGNQLISGGASYSGTGLIFDVSFLEYRIAGIEYTADATQVTLAAGDPSNPRFDAIVVDEDGAISVLGGTAASEPLTPAIGDDLVLIQYVAIGVGATTPTVSSTVVYHDNTPVNWVPSTNATGGATITMDIANTTDPAPYSGSTCAKITYDKYTSGTYALFTAPTPISREDSAILSMRVWLTENLLTIDGGLGRRPMIRLLGINDDTGNLASTGNIFLHTYGLQRDLINTWQLVTIPLSAITGVPGVTTYNSMRIHLQEFVQPSTVIPPDCTIVYDEINIQTGFGPQVNQSTIDVLNRGTVAGATSKLDFIPLSGTSHKITEDTANNKINLKLNIPGVNAEAAVSSTLDTNSDKTTVVILTAQDANFTINSPTGTPQNAQKLMFRILDDGTARSITWSAIFIPIGVTLPTTTTANKTLYIGCMYNSQTSKWDVIAITEEV